MKQVIVVLGVFFVVACGDGREFASSNPAPTATPNPMFVVKSAGQMTAEDFRPAGPSESGVANPEPTPTATPVIE